MAKFKFAVVSEATILDQTNRLSIINMYNQIKAPNLPAVHPVLNLVGYVDEIKPDESVKIHIALTSPAGDIILQQEQDLAAAVDKTSQSVGFIIQFQAIPLKEYGIHKIKIKLNSKEVDVIKLPVMPQ